MKGGQEKSTELIYTQVSVTVCFVLLFLNLVLLNIASLGCVYNNSQNIFM